MPSRKAPATRRIQAYLNDPKVWTAIEREARVSKIPLSQAAGRAMARGIRKSIPADPEDRLLQLDRHLRNHMRAMARDIVVLQEVQVETLRELFRRLPEGALERDPQLSAAADTRVDRVLDRVAERIVRGRPTGDETAPDEALMAAE